MYGQNVLKKAERILLPFYALLLIKDTEYFHLLTMINMVML